MIGPHSLPQIHVKVAPGVGTLTELRLYRRLAAKVASRWSPTQKTFDRAGQGLSNGVVAIKIQ
jgi:hypothetical protein